ncbi:Maf family protein [Methylobacterium isbiliense]|uniref:Nucleoside triphosphate pyrophosphatase n=1 Tax=Methylobacterium isbiliense TaxID=315478 RepID=A0ABQ4SJI4_9HYPH|nr:Maf family protein [Methylobacterium isbiliense]MDN3626488.1 Maf family protein [Methylobacterium isbiliense]GJE03371.1 7-methyl-GTP pyrophosphatase [Methylobacterium isbiliense]
MTASLWRAPAPLLLASASPTRRALLEAAGLPVETRSPGIDERALEAERPGDGPQDLARRLATAKALAVAAASPDRVVVGADQVLDLDGEVFHKPADLRGARDHLARLQGRTHALHAAVAVAVGGRLADAFVETARLAMRPLDGAAIDTYLAVAGARVLGSVGAYQLEGPGIHLFARIEGDHTTILGLPLLPLLARLRARDLLAF